MRVKCSQIHHWILINLRIPTPQRHVYVSSFVLRPSSWHILLYVINILYTVILLKLSHCHHFSYLIYISIDNKAAEEVNRIKHTDRQGKESENNRSTKKRTIRICNTNNHPSLTTTFWVQCVCVCMCEVLCRGKDYGLGIFLCILVLHCIVLYCVLLPGVFRRLSPVSFLKCFGLYCAHIFDVQLWIRATTKNQTNTFCVCTHTRDIHMYMYVYW